MKKSLRLLALLSVIFTACEGGLNEEDNGDMPSTPKIEISQQIIEVDFEAATYSISVTSPFSWKAISDNDWIIVENDMGIAGSSTLSFNVLLNTGEKERKGSIVIANSSHNLIAELFITQKAFTPKISITTESLTFVTEGGTQEVAITTNFEYETNVSAEWLSCTKSKNGIAVTVPNYVGEEERAAEITISNEKYNISKEINVIQKAFAPIITINPESLSFAVEGGTQEVTISANVEYEVNEDVSWLSFEKYDKGIKITAIATDIFEERTTSLTISSKKYGISKSVRIVQAAINKNSIICYTSSNRELVHPCKTDVFGANIVLNTYDNDQGIIVFDAPIASIGDYAFYNCTLLTSITIPNSVTSIGNYAFFNCTSLTKVNICDLSAWCKIYFKSNDANPLCHGAKLYLNGIELTDITIPSDITEIRSRTFYNCESLTRVIIPDKITSIGSYAFYDCSSLTSVTIGKSVTSIAGGAFKNCKSLASITIPDSVTKIGSNSFGDGAFSGCTSLTCATLGNGINMIGDSTFSGCSSLTNITIPNNITSIGDFAFWSCRSLIHIYCKATIAPAGGSSMFSITGGVGFFPSSFNIYVPMESVSAYKATEYWKDYASYIVGYDF